ncbi:predicted protein [Naegleria gruberi]|uniref:Predicted protein n=1 Tax=Naegleria gruberi TaxID=5762 RepID=D2VUN4_NAEGR|nr:uncharacterized protein NAEGRDRAFT_72726 [Naegleria gruberi]EFC39539.1 predicted protein [Naegleria gruberi]|eukprot:XP_002672283.1 predicted protein [Naegleria gruberi strain NEG-M]
MSRYTPLFLLVLVLVLTSVIVADFAPAPGPSPTPIPLPPELIDVNTTIIDTTVVTSADLFPVDTSLLKSPTSVLVKDANTIIVVDSGSHRLLFFSDNGAPAYVLAGAGYSGNATIDLGGSAFGPTSPLNSPSSVVFMDSDTVLFTDTNNDFIKKLVLSSGILQNYVGSGNRSAEYAPPYDKAHINLIEPKGLALYSSILYVTSNDKIFRVGTDGFVNEIEIDLGIQQGGLQKPTSLAMSSSDILYICDSETNLIKRYNVSSKLLETVVGSGENPFTSENDALDPLSHNLNNPQGIALSPDGKMLYIADTDSGKIKVFNIEKNTIRTILAESKYGISVSKPVGLYVHSNGTLYFTDTNTLQIGRLNLMNCDTNSSDPQCLISYCYGKLSNDSSVCSGRGNCAKTDTCSCRVGFVGNQCQFNSSFLINAINSNYDVEIGKSQVLQINVSETITNGINFIWNCEKCAMPIDNNFSSLLFNASSLGTFIVTVRVNHIQEGAIIRTSNSVNFTVTVIPPIGVDNSTFNSTYANNSSFDSTSNVTDIIKAISLSQNQMIDSVLTGFNIDTKRFLALINQNECNSCSTIISISWKLVYEERIYSSSDQITTRGTANKNSNFTSISLNPFVNVKGLVKLEGSTNFATLSFTITGAIQNTMVINHTIPVASSIIRKSSNSNLNISPNRGVGLYTLFSIQENESDWKIFSADQSPLSFAIGIVYNNQTLRLTEFVPMGQQLLTYLPFTKNMEQNKPTDLVVFAKDNLSNVQSVLVQSVVTMLRFYSTPSEAMSLMKTDSRIAKVVPYDSSFTGSSDEYDQLLLMAMQNFTISAENPTVGLGSLYSMSEKNLTTSVSNLIIQNLDSYLGNSVNSYKTQKSQQGFVSSKISDEDTKTILSTSSNLVQKGLDSRLATKLSSLLVISSIPTLLTSSDTLLPSTIITSANINITYSSFSKDSASTSTVTNRFDSILFEADSILAQYSSFSTEVGLSVVSFNGIVYPETNATFAANAKDFTMHRNGNSMNLKSLVKPFSISFNSNTPISSSNNSRIICKYWNETMSKWDTDGCTLKSLNSATGEIVCSCTHTTLFSAFIEQVPVGITFEPYVDQFIGVHGTQIALGSVYLICAVAVLIGLALNANKQPVKSRFTTPFLGMAALITQSSLLLIVQRSVLISSTQSNDANSYLASSILANIITIIVNTITLCAIMTYLYQVMRFEFLKYFYNELSLMNDKVTASRFLHFIKHLISAKFYSIMLITFAFINLAYWTLWVILVRTNVITGPEYTQIVSISYTVAILFIGFAVCCIFSVDLIMTWYQRNLNKNETTNRSKESQKMKAQNILGKVFNFLFSWFVEADSPLFFRAEMILFVISFIFLVIVQALGMASLNYRLLLTGYTETKLAPLAIVRTVVTYDSVSIIFEVLHIVTYMLVYGGYSLLVLLAQRMKVWNGEKNEQEKVEINQYLENPIFLKIFDSFCRKEFSLENLQLYLHLTKNSNIIEKGLAEIIEFINNIYDDYVKSGSIREVNIPSDCRKSFASMVAKLKNANNLELVDEKQSVSKTKKNSLPANLSDMVVDNIKSLTDQILINLSDTFSRFFYTQEFEEYSTSSNSREELLKQSNLM